MHFCLVNQCVGISSDDRALAKHAGGTGINTQMLRFFSSTFL